MTGPPPPPPGSPPPPPLGAAASPAPPPAFRAGAAPAATGFQRQVDPELRKLERRESRSAMLALAAKPEIIAIAVTFVVMWLSIAPQEILGAVVGFAVFAIFGAIYMSSADSVIASLQLGALGILAGIFVNSALAAELDSLLWLIPGLVVVASEAAATYNTYRRRDGEISARIPRSAGSNLLAITALSIVVASIVRALVQVDGRVEWPWFATTIIVLSLGFFAAMVVIRRSATPADTRRFNPGRRMLPPPRT